MDDFKRKYYRIKFLLVELVSKIDKLQEENHFFEKIGTIKSEIAEVLALKDDLMTENTEELKKIEPELNEFTKQIREKFDYIIELKRNELAEVALHIRNLQNSRNLVNYNR